MVKKYTIRSAKIIKIWFVYSNKLFLSKDTPNLLNLGTIGRRSMQSKNTNYNRVLLTKGWDV